MGKIKVKKSPLKIPIIYDKVLILRTERLIDIH